jgi:hypothetical protein
VLLVARTSAAGLTAAQSALREWGSGSLPDVTVIGLVLVADAPGRLPRPLDYFATVVAGAAPLVARVPWIEQLRLGLDFDPKRDSSTRGLLAHLAAVTRPDAAAAPPHQRPIITDRRRRSRRRQASKD